MALGDIKSFSAYNQEMGTASYNNTSDVFNWVLVTESYAATDANVADPKLADFTQVVDAGAYVANTAIANTTWTTTDAVTTLTGDSFNFAANAANPITAKSLLIYNDTSADKSALQIVDLTADSGVTAASTVAGLTYTIPAGGMHTLTRTV